MVALLEKERKDGSLERFAAFHRSEEQAEHDKHLAEAAAAADKACGGHLEAKVAWDSVTDDALKQYSISSFCEAPLSALGTLCGRSKVAAAILRERVKAVTCRFAGPMKLGVDGGTLSFAVDQSSSNTDEFARKALEDLEVGAPIARSAGLLPPWGDGRTLGQQITLARTGVCTDGKSHFAVASPSAPSGPQLFYGDGKKLSEVRVVEVLGAGTFFEPRFANPTANPDFRGADMRVYSSLEFDEDKQTCKARCGARKVDLKVLAPADAGALLAGATYGPPLEQHAAHSLTRDDRGNYYYVDKGATPETARRFRLYVGPKGNLKLQQMINVVSDSQGEIFSTRRGELRFIVGPKGTESFWVHGKARTRLLAVPIEENWALIYNELGVYLGERRGTPCDDL